MDCNIFEWIWEKCWPARKIGRFIKRFFLYLPIIWRDEDWDYDYLYQLIKFKLERMAIAQDNDDLHVDSKRRATQIRICLAYLDRYRNWTDYIEYPMEDIGWEPCGNGCLKMIHKSNINEAKRRKVHGYEEFNYDMFWKRFLQWHRGWWT